MYVQEKPELAVKTASYFGSGAEYHGSPQFVMLMRRLCVTPYEVWFRSNPNQD